MDRTQRRESPNGVSGASRVTSRLTGLVGVAVLLIAGLASASEDVFEINQACAVGAGCFPGDAPGFPVTIGEPGRYRLTSNLAIADVDTSGIGLSGAIAGLVWIDLGGFEIRGPVVCPLPPLGCPLSGGTGDGIHFVATDLRSSLAVENGSIVGMGRYAVYSSARPALIRGIRASHSGGRYGILVAEGSIISDSASSLNAGGGFFIEKGLSHSIRTAW